MSQNCNREVKSLANTIGQNSYKFSTPAVSMTLSGGCHNNCRCEYTETILAFWLLLLVTWCNEFLD